MEVTSFDPNTHEAKTISTKYPIFLTIVLAALFLVLGFVFLGTGLNEVNNADLRGVSSYPSINFIIMVISFFVAFDLLMQITAFSMRLNRKGYEALAWLVMIGVYIVFYVVYCGQLDVIDFTVVLWAPILFGINIPAHFMRQTITLINSDKTIIERTIAYVIASVVFDILLFGLLTVIVANLIWLILCYVILCVVLRKEPIGYIIIIIVK